MVMEEDTEVSGLTLRNRDGRKDCLKINGCGNVKMEKVESENVKMNNGWFMNICGKRQGSNNREESELLFSILSSSFDNITCEDESAGVIDVEKMIGNVEFSNCSFRGCSSGRKNGKMISLMRSKNMQMKQCLFDGKEERKKELNGEVDVCKWNGSVVDVKESTAEIKDTSFLCNFDGCFSIWGGNAEIEAGNISFNNPSIEGYPSLRRNIICSDSGILNVMSLKGGDGALPNTSMCILNEGCAFEGIASERDSSFFIPVLESVEAREETDKMKLTFKGMLLVPCNLSFSVVKRKGEEKEIEHYAFDSNGFLSEREAEGSATKDLLSGCGDEIEMSEHILFGNAESPSSTNPFILKYASETKGNGDGSIVEREKGSNSSLVLIVCTQLLNHF
ncbi:uncharacterized protein MONOS_16050 [Monocercomonoides exilis]|uniref:uncharacterized protein n=1 Tax=Monocercomonoides exilis TaxID=2049356 RepID=UPI003559D130|nr:hypothetical protein MONOS_16050 [Monocercomonoides exilis]|eukprot:MONOS_16050.1-p1 / transcript=MONOS_16050.1 / gene=MONOS_16050 / organism=Monocercomonoides_exilis_PA203 / gene_product=unspecified product / transcript_product=unspecified product / location=Mono_scaffold01477:1305-2480(-) / protein_length=392 / sequence_SO=supercontig / SO=protein_coding / is_pseudo=false